MFVKLSHSLSFPVREGASHHPNPFQEVQRRRGSVVKLSPGHMSLIVDRTLERHMFHRFVSAVTMWAGGRAPAPNTVQVSCCQRRMASAYLHHRDALALVHGKVMFPVLVSVFPIIRERSMDPGMWIAEVPFLSDTVLMPASISD